MWADELTEDEKKAVLMLSGTLDLPSLTEYKNLGHFLHDVYGKIVESKSLVRQLSKSFNVLR